MLSWFDDSGEPAVVRVPLRDDCRGGGRVLRVEAEPRLGDPRRDPGTGGIAARQIDPGLQWIAGDYCVSALGSKELGVLQCASIQASAVAVPLPMTRKSSSAAPNLVSVRTRGDRGLRSMLRFDPYRFGSSEAKARPIASSYRDSRLRSRRRCG